MVIFEHIVSFLLNAMIEAERAFRKISIMLSFIQLTTRIAADTQIKLLVAMKCLQETVKR